MKILFASLLVAATWLSLQHANASESYPCRVPCATTRAVVRTSLGDLVFGFYPDVAPGHVAQVIQLLQNGSYHGSEIFRIEKGFVAQVENYDMRRTPLAP